MSVWLVMGVVTVLYAAFLVGGSIICGALSAASGGGKDGGVKELILWLLCLV